MLYSSNSKCHIESVYSNYMTKDISIMYYFTLKKGEYSSYGNNKDKSIGFETICKRLDPTLNNMMVEIL